jgi:hypothetical protein
MSEVFLSLTELGKLYGVSSHQIGKWLKQVGLRTKDNKPSPRAFKEGYVEQRGSTQPGTYYWIWHGEKTLKVLTEAGFKPGGNTAPNPQSSEPSCH